MSVSASVTQYIKNHSQQVNNHKQEIPVVKTKPSTVHSVFNKFVAQLNAIGQGNNSDGKGITGKTFLRFFSSK